MKVRSKLRPVLRITIRVPTVVAGVVAKVVATVVATVMTIGKRLRIVGMGGVKDVAMDIEVEFDFNFFMQGFI